MKAREITLRGARAFAARLLMDPTERAAWKPCGCDDCVYCAEVLKALDEEKSK